jgi:hypothetical protein
MIILKILNINIFILMILLNILDYFFSPTTTYLQAEYTSIPKYNNIIFYKFYKTNSLQKYFLQKIFLY